MYKDHHVVTLMGRLGNQLFQYSFAQWLEQTSGHPVAYDLSHVRTLDGIPEGLRNEFARKAVRGSSSWPAVGGRF